MFNPYRLNLQWRIKRFISLVITLLERRSLFSNGELMIKNTPLLDSKVFENIEQITQLELKKNRFILNKETLSFILESFKSDEFMSLFKRMGVTKPEISHVTFYQIEHLEDPTQSVYANHWHTDDTLRPNAVKFFQLPDEIDESVGPMETLDRKDTVRNWKKGFIRGGTQPTEDATPFKFMSNRSGLLLNSNKCMHRAGVPGKGKRRRMLMAQINDGAGRCSIDKLYERQFFVEPTLLKNLFSFK